MKGYKIGVKYFISEEKSSNQEIEVWEKQVCCLLTKLLANTKYTVKEIHTCFYPLLMDAH